MGKAPQFKHLQTWNWKITKGKIQKAAQKEEGKRKEKKKGKRKRKRKRKVKPCNNHNRQNNGQIIAQARDLPLEPTKLASAPPLICSFTLSLTCPQQEEQTPPKISPKTIRKTHISESQKHI